MYEQFKHDKEFEIAQYKFETEQQQLFKEDFIVHKYFINCRDEEFPFDNKCRTCGWKRIINLKDNSKYDKLPSKLESKREK